MARTSSTSSERSRARARAKRRAARRATRRAVARSLSQLLVVLVGGAVAGGAAVLAAFPEATDPVPPAGCLAAAGVAALATAVTARRLRPRAVPAQGRSRR